ncbi:octanoyltransferase [Ahniella affigens]|uniref:Octanoyltransferase n=1 Tax=Ahniella affigens TaxID=2021234 RepID=A0A2P1PVC2_9GAMM|nr:lipoyl(octanoyl) transferase LipB [Ahniella affigens]AVP98805.1 octanoyltransferase [Ahniella affigens]
MDAVTPIALRVRNLGRQAYEPVWRAMQAYTDQRDGNAADELWLVEHDPVFTQGQAGKAEHVLAPGDIPVVQVDRGGQVTYHGPGQIVAYPLFDLRRLGIGVKALVFRIEQALIDTLAEFGVTADRLEGAPGVYVGPAKVAALGLRVRRGCSFHGLAFNIQMDLEPFARINPCGYRGLQVVNLAELNAAATFSAVQQTLVRHLWQQFHRTSGSEEPVFDPAVTEPIPELVGT